jgi:allantoin racemase
VLRGEADGYDAYVIACFGDPGLLAAREVARGPVIGIAEAAMHVASMVSNAFSVVTTLDRTVAIAEHLVEQYGMTRFCRNIRGTEIAVLDLERPGTAARRQIIDECRRAIKEDRAEAIVLGCAGMAELAAEISVAIGAPVIEGVRAAGKLAEGFVQLGVGTSKRGSLAYPLAKPYVGMLSAFAPKEGPQKNAAGRQRNIGRCRSGGPARHRPEFT